jgi:hypothetical protein
VTRAASRVSRPKDNGLTTAILFQDGYEKWGWVCWRCTRPGVPIEQDGFGTRDGARRAAKKHETRRGH